jgi:23S rRNA-/tRNA-specific pseudouridylate synthase
MITIPRLYEDESVIVIDKPSGIVVNRAESVKEETIQDWMEEEVIQNSKLKNQKFENEDFIVEKRGIFKPLRSYS